jgi:hypothetical protein
MPHLNRDPKSFTEQIRSSSSWTLLDANLPKFADAKALLAAQAEGLRRLNEARDKWRDPTAPGMTIQRQRQ